MRVNKSELATLIRRSERTLSRWIDEGLPRAVAATTRGQSDEYDVADVFAWVLARETAGHAAGADGEVIVFEAERARLTKEQADKAAMENALRRGVLIDAERAAALWANILVNVKTKLLSIPTKSAPLLLGCKTMPQARDVVERFIVEALNDLVSADPTADQGGEEGTAAAAEIDSQSVGGPSPPPKPRKQRGAGAVDN